MLCFFAFFICFTGYIGAGTILMFAVVRTLHGLPFGATTVANSTVAIDVLPSSRRNEGVGFYGLSNNLAMAIAPLGRNLYLLSQREFSVALLDLSGGCFVGFYFVSTIRLPHRPPVEGKQKLSMDHFFLSRAWLMAINILLFGLCWGIMSNYVAIYGKGKNLASPMAQACSSHFFQADFCFAPLWSQVLREGHLTEKCPSGAAISSVGFTLFARSGSVGLLSVGRDDRTWQRPHVPGFF